MCDTILASPATTADNSMLFGKNSDRQRNEAQTVEFFPRADHAAAAQLKCTYITIPQARRTHAVLLCRPFWIWGAEMGANEYGVVIGNEGLYSRMPAPEKQALIGMDLVRLALERATSAAEALDTIVGLLETHGQGGNCGHLTPAYYHNSFMIADPDDAFVLETVGREWLVERVSGVRAISNEYSIGRTAERTSSGLSGLVRSFGWQDEASPNYADWLPDPERSHVGTSRGRARRATAILGAGSGRLRVADIMKTLRDHDPTGEHENEWNPIAILDFSLCVHAGSGDRTGQTTGALASEIRRRDSVHWVTGTAASCISIFKPVLMDVSLPAHGARPTDRFDPDALWWQHEKLHRAALSGDLPRFIAGIRAERDAAEADFHARVTSVLNGGDAGERARVVTACWQEAAEMTGRWVARCAGASAADRSAYDLAWSEMSKVAGLG